MPVSHKLRCIYIHVPKCAGKSVTTALRQADNLLDFIGRAGAEWKDRGIPDLWLHHLPAATLKTLIPAALWNGYYKFAFVRNPWALMVSYYHYHRVEFLQSPEFRRDWPGIAARFARASTFDEWLATGIYVRPQVEFLCDRGGELLMDFVGKVEHLKSGFSAVSAHLGIPASLGHLNATEHRGYRSYYSEAAFEAVRTHFEHDIAAFNYTFDE